MKKGFLLIILFTLLIVTIDWINHPFITYERNYYKKIGIQGAWRYCDIVEEKGEPTKIEPIDGRYYVKYDGLILVYDNIEKGIMESARITGKQYRFGLWRIGVGTPKTKVESVYKHIKKIKDLPENEFGVIEGATWVYFNFDENNCVSQITLTRGI